MTRKIEAEGAEAVKAFVAAGGNPEDMKINVAPIPQVRPAVPDEIADVAVFLSGEGASYVNGATWAVDGGLTAI